MPPIVASPSYTMLPARLELGELTLELGEELRAALAAYRADEQVSEALVAELAQTYSKLGTLPQVVEYLHPAALELLHAQCKQMVTQLINLDVMDYTPTTLLERFGEAGGFDAFEKALTDLTDAYVEIHEDEEAREEIRRMRQANRFRVQGGGFGIAGAAKGMATAGAFNLATGAVVGSFNRAGRIFSAIGNSSKEKQLYAKARAGLLAAFYMSVLWLFDEYREVLREHGKSAVQGFGWLAKRAGVAARKYENVVQLEGLAPEKKLRLVAECLQLAPHEAVYYDALARLRGDAPDDLLALARWGRHYCPEALENERITRPFASALVAAFEAQDAPRLAALEATTREAFGEEGASRIASQAQTALLALVEARPEEERKALLERALTSSLLGGEAVHQALEDLSLALHGTALMNALRQVDATTFEREALALRGALSAKSYQAQEAPIVAEARRVLKSSGAPLGERRRLVEAVLAAGFDGGLAEESRRAFADEARKAQARRALSSGRPNAPAPGETSAPLSPPGARGFEESLRIALFLEQMHHRLRGAYYETPGYEFKDNALIRRAYAYRSVSGPIFWLKAALGAFFALFLAPSVFHSDALAGLLVFALFPGILIAAWVRRRRQRRAWERFDHKYMAMQQGRVDAAVALLDDVARLKLAAEYMFRGRLGAYAPAIPICLPLLFIPPFGWVGAAIICMIAEARYRKAKRAYEALAQALKD